MGEEEMRLRQKKMLILMGENNNINESSGGEGA